MNRVFAPVLISVCFFATLSTGCDPRVPAYIAAVNGSASPRVNVIDGVSLTRRASFQFFDASFTGGVRVATGDVNGDGYPELIGATGPGAAQVKVRDGLTGAASREFQPYGSGFTGGVFVAAGDVNGDGLADIITGADTGAFSEIKVFSAADNSELHAFIAFGTFAGGVRVASGRTNTDGHAEIIAGAGPGGSPQVNVYDGASLSLIQSFFAYAPTFTGGVFVAAGDVNGDGLADIITGADAGGPPHVKVFSGLDASELLSFFAYDTNFTGGVRVAAIDANSDGKSDILCGPGAGGGSQLKVFSGADGSLLNSFQSFDTDGANGVFVAADSYSLSHLLVFQE